MQACLRAAAFAIALFASGASAFAAAPDEKTGCAAFVQALDQGQRNELLDYMTYVSNVFDQLDLRHTQNGEPGIATGWSDKGRADNVLVAFEECRQHPRMTIYNAAAVTYAGLRALETSLGVAR